MFSKSDISKMKKYCSDDVYRSVLGIQKKQEYNNQVRIVNTGMVSSGKSSIYNSLIDSINEERFPTGAARTTVTADEIVSEHNIVFIDTPGIDVRDEDDELAFDTVASADLILMIHNVKDGDLKKSEIDWVERLRNQLGSEFLQQKMVFIGSWIDERDRDEDYQELINKLKDMLLKSVGGEVSFFQVSAKRYLTGKKNGKNALVEKSGVNELREYLFSRADALLEKKSSSLSDEARYILGNALKNLENSKKERTDLVAKIRKDAKNYYQSRLDNWEAVFSTFKEYKSRLKELKKEIKEI